MVKHLFLKFLSDPAEYAGAQEHWEKLWARLPAVRAAASSWQCPWIANTFADGTPMRDGNPIFSAICPPQRKAVRILQHAPRSDEAEFEFWLDTFAGDGEEQVQELVISCALSDHTSVEAFCLINGWVSGAIRAKQNRGGVSELEPCIA